MKRTLLKKADILSVLLCFVPIVLGLLVFSKLPNEVPVHFDINGEPDGYASKAFAVFGIPSIMALIQLVMCIITNLAWKENRTGRGEVVIRLLVPLVGLLTEGAMLLFALGRLKNMMSIVGLILSFIFFVVGNYLPKVRRNVIYGIRTPHTLADPVVWDKTHRVAGPVMVCSSILFLVITIMELPPVLYLAVLGVSLIVPFVYSEIVYKKRASERDSEQASE